MEENQYCNKCMFLIPTEIEEFSIEKIKSVRRNEHMCMKYNENVYHNKGCASFNSPIFPCDKCRTDKVS